MPLSSDRRKSNYKGVPEHTISRLSIYLRCLRLLEDEDIPTVSSEDLARRFGLNAAQIRKDLAYFGDFGVRGVGYNVLDLKDQLMEIMGLHRRWRVVLFGLGNLGRALLSYRGFSQAGFHVVGIFEANAGIVAQGTIRDIPIFPAAEAKTILPGLNVDIAIITVPAEFAQDVANTVVDAGIEGVLNFAPVALKLPPDVRLRGVDLTINLENISFFLNTRG